MTTPESNEVGRTEIAEGISVSTVFVGIDISHWGQGKPALFETMIFGGPDDLRAEVSCTWSEAQEVHNRVVEKAKAAQEAD